MNDISSANFLFSKEMRLLTSPQFRRVFDKKCSAADNVLIVYGALNGLDFSRLGMAVSRKVGNAVIRNCWKRHIREGFRLEYASLPQGMDLVVLPRKGAIPRSENISDSISTLSRRVEKRLRRAKK